MSASDSDRKVSIKHHFPPFAIQHCDHTPRTSMLATNVCGNQILEVYQPTTPGTPRSPGKYSR